MFGSTRFMAPEEHELGATIDERRTLFNLGRATHQLLASADAEVARRACELEPQRRYETLREFHEAWLAAARLAPRRSPVALEHP